MPQHWILLFSTQTRPSVVRHRSANAADTGDVMPGTVSSTPAAAAPYLSPTTMLSTMVLRSDIHSGDWRTSRTVSGASRPRASRRGGSSSSARRRASLHTRSSARRRRLVSSNRTGRCRTAGSCISMTTTPGCSHCSRTTTKRRRSGTSTDFLSVNCSRTAVWAITDAAIVSSPNTDGLCSFRDH